MRREIEEELGFALTTCEPIATFFVSRRLIRAHLALLCRGHRSRARWRWRGVAAELEDIRIVRMSAAAAKDALRQGTLADAKTIIGLQWLVARASL